MAMSELSPTKSGTEPEREAPKAPRAVSPAAARAPRRGRSPGERAPEGTQWAARAGPGSLRRLGGQWHRSRLLVRAVMRDRRAAAYSAPLLRHHHGGAVADPGEQVGDVLVVHADAAIGHEAADRAWLVGAVDGVFAARQGHCRDAHGIMRGAAGNHRRQIRLVAADVCRRRPRRIDVFAVDVRSPGPLLAQ